MDAVREARAQMRGFRKGKFHNDIVSLEEEMDHHKDEEREKRKGNFRKAKVARDFFLHMQMESS
ncbi:MAG: hypothetical protein AAF701_09980, partial [Pseudomonadota bacterium]